MSVPELKEQFDTNESSRKKEFRARNLERLKEKSRILYLSNPEKRKYWDLWRKNNKDKVRQYAKTSNLKNKEKRAFWVKRHYELNKEKIRTYKKNYVQKNKEKYRIYAFNRRSLKRAVGFNINKISEFVGGIKNCKTVLCSYCNKRIPSLGCHIDHIIPLSKGGFHCVENLCVSCPTCNRSKGSKLLHEWIRSGQQILPL